MEIVFLLAATLASLVHIYIFILETFLWTRTSTRKTFGLTLQEANATKTMAANQGVYNGALAIAALAGVCMYGAGLHDVGGAIILGAVGVMAIAAAYLFVTAPDKRAAALKQLLFPFLTIVVAIWQISL